MENEKVNPKQESECAGCNYSGGKCPFTGQWICNLTGDHTDGHAKPCTAWFE